MPGAVRKRAPGADGGPRRVLAQPALELTQQAGLAHARLADDRHEVRRALADDPLVERLERGELLLPADERRLARGRHAPHGVLGDQAHGLPRRHPLRLALQVERLELLVPDRGVRGAHGALADGDAARRGRALKPGGDVHGVAGDGVGVADRAGEHLAGVHAHAQREVGARRQAVVHLGHRVLHAEPRAHRPLGIVLVGHRRAEDGHDVVADVLVDGAAVALDLPAEAHERTVHERLHRLRVHPLGEGRVAGQVGEQDRDLAALLGWDLGSPARGRCRRGEGDAPSSAAPQFMQKRASGGAGVPQFGQRRSRPAPQFMQKRAPAGFWVPHAAQSIG